jgi:broad specificity phosphatase PhoE
MIWLKQRMTIYLMRHGESEGNKRPSQYGLVGDANIGLTDPGWMRTVAAGSFLRSELEREALSEWPRMWTSSLLRAKQSLSGVLHGMEGFLPDAKERLRIFENSDLVEQHYGWLPYLDPASEDPEVKAFSKLIMEFSKKVYDHNAFTAHTPFGESPQMTMGRAKDFIDTLRRDLDGGIEHHVVVAHGATLKALIMKCFHLSMEAWKELKTPGNADIFRLEFMPENGRIAGIRQIWDGENMRIVDINPIENIKPTTINDLPMVPAHLRLTPHGS